MRTLTPNLRWYYLDSTPPIARSFQLRSAHGYRDKSVTPMFRGEFGGSESGYHHSRGLLRMIACSQDDWEELGIQFPLRKRREMRTRLWGRLWGDDHYNRAIHGAKSWKRRCRKRHQWEPHRHSQYEVFCSGLGYAYHRPFILDKLQQNGGCYTFRTAHRYDLEETLQDMELAGEITLSSNFNIGLYHREITASLVPFSRFTNGITMEKLS